jgi:hypothetical protein
MTHYSSVHGVLHNNLTSTAINLPFGAFISHTHAARKQFQFLQSRKIFNSHSLPILGPFFFSAFFVQAPREKTTTPASVHKVFIFIRTECTKTHISGRFFVHSVGKKF